MVKLTLTILIVIYLVSFVNYKYLSGTNCDIILFELNSLMVISQLLNIKMVESS